jgi:DNA-binding response OmpR family regulator
VHHVLLIEDDIDIAEGLVAYLERAKLRVSHAEDGLRALELFFGERPNLVLLDLNLPRLSGLEVLRQIREVDRTPVIALTARTGQEDRLQGFALGADDYIPKPFWALEVVARVEAVLRRSEQGVNAVLRGAAGLMLYLEAREVKLNDHPLELRPAEFNLLAAFLRTPNRVFTRSELLEAIGKGDSDTLERAVDVHVKNLRKKIGVDQPLETVFGVGYRYVMA